MHGTPVPKDLLLEFANAQLAMRDAETCEMIQNAIKNMDTFKLGDWTPPLKDEEGQVTTKFCRDCHEQRPLEAYAGSDHSNQCNTCRRDKQKDKEAEKESKTCDVCETEKPIASFDTGHRKCTDCRHSYSDANVVIKSTRYSARRRGIVFVDDDTEFMKSKLSQPCYYCGRQSDPLATNEEDKKLNGLDRVDNSGPYSASNTVSSCKVCNLMKHSKSISEFYQATKKIAMFNQMESDHSIPYSTWKKSGTKFGFKQETRDPKERTHETVIARETIRNSPDFRKNDYCYLCGRHFKKNERISVDRINPQNREVNRGYTLENTAACCWTCNEMKKDNNLNLFLQQCNRIAKGQCNSITG